METIFQDLINILGKYTFILPVGVLTWKT